MRQRTERFGWSRSIGTVLVGILALAASPAPASAKKFLMSGTWVQRGGQVFLPLQFAQSLMGSRMTQTSMGDLSKAYFFPNGPIGGAGFVTTDGSPPAATLMVPMHRFLVNAAAALPLAGITLVQITTMFAIDAPLQPVTLMAGGGPGSFQWCPESTLSCPVSGAPDGGRRNGRVIYVSGANRFGGSMQIGMGGGGINSFVFNQVPFQVGHVYFGGTGTMLRPRAVGVGTPADPNTRMVYLAPGVVTQPTMTPTPNGLVLYPGPKLTTMLGLTTTGTAAAYRLPAIGFSTQGMPAGQISTGFGFAHTTGTVIAQQTAGSAGDDFFTVMGSDMRTALGAGNISTVAGGVNFRNTLAGQTLNAQFDKVWFSLAVPTPTLSPAGFVSAGMLILLSLGYALRRRLPRAPARPPRAAPGHPSRRDRAAYSSTCAPSSTTWFDGMPK